MALDLAEARPRATPAARRVSPLVTFALRKATRYSLVLLAIATINFALPRLMPGDPLINLLGEYAVYDAQAIAQARERLGIDGPLHEQYWRYLVDLVRGNWGYSFTFMRPIGEVLGRCLGWTLLLLVPSVFLGALLAVPLGTLAGWKRGTRADVGVTALALFVHSMPHYWLAMLVVMVFAFRLDLFPLGRAISGDAVALAYLANLLWHLTLPLAVVTLYKASYDIIIIRNSVIAVSGEDHVLAARARGVPLPVLLINHVVRNSLGPLVTVTALQLGNVFAGALLVEMVFSWPGMGTLIYDAVAGRDYPLLQASFLLIAVCVLLANFLADLAYAWLDPRIAGGR
jgi:peptide/nickel transport system permease protein